MKEWAYVIIISHYRLIYFPLIVEIESNPDGTVYIFTEVCNRRYHGKRTLYSLFGIIYNDFYRDGRVIASKKVSAAEAFYTKEGLIQTADR